MNADEMERLRKECSDGRKKVDTTRLAGQDERSQKRDQSLGYPNFRVAPRDDGKTLGSLIRDLDT